MLKKACDLNLPLLVRSKNDWTGPRKSNYCDSVNKHALNYWFSDQACCCQFVYGGCHGNNNRFESEQECEAVCTDHDDEIARYLVDKCSQNIKPGPCAGNFTRLVTRNNGQESILTHSFSTIFKFVGDIRCLWRRNLGCFEVRFVKLFLAYLIF